VVLPKAACSNTKCAKIYKKTGLKNSWQARGCAVKLLQIHGLMADGCERMAE